MFFQPLEGHIRLLRKALEAAPRRAEAMNRGG
jgi:hypothetical protein